MTAYDGSRYTALLHEICVNKPDREVIPVDLETVALVLVCIAALVFIVRR